MNRTQKVRGKSLSKLDIARENREFFTAFNEWLESVRDQKH
jgi:hypothetical protein